LLNAPDAVQNVPDGFAFLAQPSVQKTMDSDSAVMVGSEPKTEPSVPDGAVETTDETAEKRMSAEEPTPEFRVIGEAFRTYIFVEVQDKIWIIDKHAAHERMLYEQLRSAPDGKASQLLLTPVPVTLRKEEYDAVLRHADMLADAGFTVEDFGTGTVFVTSCPILLDASDVPDAVAELAAYLCRSSQQILTEKMDWIYHNTACRAAIKGGDFTSEYELRRFTEKLLSMPQIRTCPHGRPVMVEVTRREMEKSFGRV
jgi:DNA mismatch repair protein MutL